LKITKDYISSKLPLLREFKVKGKVQLSEKKFPDDELVETLFVILNSKSFTSDLDMVEDDDRDLGDHQVNQMLQDNFARAMSEKYKYEDFNMVLIKKKIFKEVGKATNVHSEVGDIYHLLYGMINFNNDRIKFNEIFENKINVLEHLQNYGEAIGIIYDSMNIIAKNRNVKGVGVHFASNLPKEKLIGKYTVTEDNILSGFMKHEMILKYIGYLPGKIVETRYGERHGYDNAWDDHVSKRDYLVLELENVTDSKEFKKWKSNQYAIDITNSLKVFDTMEKAREVAAQLNEYYKNQLTLDQ